MKTIYSLIFSMLTVISSAAAAMPHETLQNHVSGRLQEQIEIRMKAVLEGNSDTGIVVPVPDHGADAVNGMARNQSGKTDCPCADPSLAG